MPAFAAFVINLERDLERRQIMEEELAKAGIVAEFRPAVDGRTLGEAERALCDGPRMLRVYGHPMMDSEIGCYLSHYRLYEHMLERGLDAALVMEDDIEISPGLRETVDALVADLERDPEPEWLVVRLETLRRRVREARVGGVDYGRKVRDLPHGGLYRLDVNVLGFGAYLIRREGARRIIEYGRRPFMPIDQTVDRYWENGITPYLVRPIPVRQRTEMASRIGARPAGGHLGQPWSVRLGRRVQRLRDSVRKRLYRLGLRPA